MAVKTSLKHSYKSLYKAACFLLAVLALMLGILGIFLPGLPTTPFILLAAWAATQSSPRLQHWLENHRLFGPLIRDWAKERAVNRKSKWLATIMMSACALIMAFIIAKLWVLILAVSTMAITLLWLWRRPEPSST